MKRKRRLGSPSARPSGPTSPERRERGQQPVTDLGEVAHGRRELRQPDRHRRQALARARRRSASSKSRSGSIGAGSQPHTRTTRRAPPPRDRHWERPDHLRPPWNTSPGPRPAKQTSSPSAPGATGRRGPRRPDSPEPRQGVHPPRPDPRRRRAPRRRSRAGRPRDPAIDPEGVAGLEIRPHLPRRGDAPARRLGA